MKKIYLALSLTMMVAFNLVSQTTELDVTATIDNTIFKDAQLSDGLGEYVFTGTTRAGVTKRALVMFELESIVPDDIDIDSAHLIMVPSKVKPGSTDVKIFKVATEWDEGTSEATDGDGKGAPATKNDATWIFAKYDSDRWIKEGGDFAIEASDTATVSLGENAIFSSPTITADVKLWLKNPEVNFGWIFIGDENNTSTSVKFVSRNNANNSLRPKLKIFYQTATSSPQTADKGLDLKVYQGAGLNTIIISNPGDPGLCSMEVFSITGTRIFSSHFQLSSGNNTIESGIPDPGIYVYRIIQNQKTTSGKLLISNQ